MDRVRESMSDEIATYIKDEEERAKNEVHGPLKRIISPCNTKICK